LDDSTTCEATVAEAPATPPDAQARQYSSRLGGEVGVGFFRSRYLISIGVIGGGKYEAPGRRALSDMSEPARKRQHLLRYVGFIDSKN